MEPPVVHDTQSYQILNNSMGAHKVEVVDGIIRWPGYYSKSLYGLLIFKQAVLGELARLRTYIRPVPGEFAVQAAIGS